MGEDSFVVADRGRSYKSIEAVASWVRRTMGLGVDARLPGVDFLENLDSLAEKLNVPLPVVYTVNDLPARQLATSRYERDFPRLLVTLSPATYQGLLDESDPARFSLVHEAGHIVLHHQELVRMEQFPETVQTQASLSRQGIMIQQFRNVEWQANAFAGALLVPAEGIADVDERSRGTWFDQEEYRVSQLTQQYGVSRKTARIRLKVWQEKLGGAMQ